MPNRCSAVSRRWRMARGIVEAVLERPPHMLMLISGWARAGVIRIRRRPGGDGLIIPAGDYECPLLGVKRTS